MNGIEKLPKERVRAIFTDLDDTLTNDSKLLAEPYRDLWRLVDKAYRLVLVSGRPAGWADCLMRLCPFDAVIFENGAGWMHREGEKIRTHALAGEPSAEIHRKRLREIFNEVKTKVPALRLSTDQPYRLYDFAIDYCEESPRLTDAELSTVLEALGQYPDITFKLSSIHVNYWMGHHTKVTAIRRFFSTVAKGWDLTPDATVFCGDSPNDEPMFEAFEHSVGVANISRFLPTMKHRPKYVTQAPGGLGFSQLVEFLIS